MTNSDELPEEGDVEFKDLYLRAQFVTGLFCYPVVCLFGLTGNVLSIVILSRQKMRLSTKTYLIAMSLSDGIKLINDSFYFLVILLLTIDRETGERAYGYLYPYAHYFFNMSVCTTAWLTVSVAVERYILVCHAASGRDICNVHMARIICVTVFLSMTVITVPLGARYRTVNGLDNRTNTSSVWVEVTELWLNKDFVETYTWIQNLLRSVIPLTILCILNCFIVQALRATMTYRKTQLVRKAFSSRHRVTLMLVSVIVVFMACVTPDAIMSTFFGFGYYDASYFVRALREVTDLLLTVNSALNFLLYYTFSRSFRQSLIPLTLHRRCCGFWKREQKQEQSLEMNSRVMSFATIRHSTKSHAVDEKIFTGKQRSGNHHCQLTFKRSTGLRLAGKALPLDTIHQADSVDEKHQAIQDIKSSLCT